MMHRLEILVLGLLFGLLAWAGARIVLGLHDPARLLEILRMLEG